VLHSIGFARIFALSIRELVTELIVSLVVLKIKNKKNKTTCNFLITTND
jgi:hypothetical protein